MENRRLGVGGEGWINQLKMSLDQDAGMGHKRIETRLIREVFHHEGTRSDVQRLLLRHFVEHPPGIEWIRRSWRKRLGEGWPESVESSLAGETSRLEGGGAL